MMVMCVCVCVCVFCFLLLGEIHHITLLINEVSGVLLCCYY